eukprot:1017300_1
MHWRRSWMQLSVPSKLRLISMTVNATLDSSGQEINALAEVLDATFVALQTHLASQTVNAMTISMTVNATLDSSGQEINALAEVLDATFCALQTQITSQTVNAMTISMTVNATLDSQDKK